MSLRDQLKHLLPAILPPNPAEAVKGTQLIDLVKTRLDQPYSDATLRYHFSIMCCDPMAPIAKVEHGQGYYLRPAAGGGEDQDVLESSLFEDAGNREPADTARRRYARLRAIFQRVNVTAAGLPWLFPEPPTLATRAGGPWWQPEGAVADWRGGGMTADDETATLLRGLKTALGEPPLRVTSVRFCERLSFGNHRQEFFQALSSGEWANGSELIIATRVTDEYLAEEIRRLGLRHGVGVTSYGLSTRAMDEAGSPAEILAMTDRDLENFRDRMDFSRIAPASPQRALDWDDLARRCQDSEGFSGLLRWLGKTLEVAGGVGV